MSQARFVGLIPLSPMLATHDDPVLQDDSIIQSLQNGGLKALANFFDAERPRLRQMIRNRLDLHLAQRLDASDILQESYLAAANSLKAYLSAPKLPPFLWLRGVVRKLIASQHRFHSAAKRNPRVERRAFGSGSSAILVDLLTDSMVSPASLLSRQEMQLRVLDAISQLPDQDRRIMELHYAEQLTLQEVAQEIELSYAAVKKRHIRCLKRLQAKLGSPKERGQ